MLVVAKLEELQKDMKFIGQMANVSFTVSDTTDTLGGWWSFTITVGVQETISANISKYEQIRQHGEAEMYVNVVVVGVIPAITKEQWNLEVGY